MNNLAVFTKTFAHNIPEKKKHETHLKVANVNLAVSLYFLIFLTCLQGWEEKWDEKSMRGDGWEVNEGDGWEMRGDECEMRGEGWGMRAVSWVNW